MATGYEVFREGVQDTFDAEVLGWATGNIQNILASTPMNQSMFAYTAGLHRSMISHWNRWIPGAPLSGQVRVAPDNLVPLEMVFRSLDMDGTLALGHVGGVLQGDWRQFANSGCQHVRKWTQAHPKNKTGRMMSVEEFWWVFFAFIDNTWTRATASKRPAMISAAYKAKAAKVKWTLGPSWTSPLAPEDQVVTWVADWSNLWTGR